MDQYKILGRIGEGAHGIVFKAKHIECGEIVALKKVTSPANILIARLVGPRLGFWWVGMPLASNAGPTLVVCRFSSLPLTNETPS